MVTIPYNFVPRDYQLPLFKALDSGKKRAFWIVHRRAGKDKCCINILAKKAVQKIGVYFYFLPTYTMARKVIWDGIDGDGFKFIDHLPKEIIEKKNDQEMKVLLKNGSLIQLIGTDRFDSIRGTNPIGCIFSEFAFHNPMAWEVVRPILAQNGGWAIFNSTPNGRNFAYEMYKEAKKDNDWFVELLTVDDTNAIPKEALFAERKTMEEQMYMQEFYCDFDVGSRGGYYTEEMQQVYQENRISRVPFFRDKDTNIAFDLGISDMMAMWFWQTDSGRINLINYYEDNNKKLEYYFNYIDEYFETKKGKMGLIYLPHDANKRELITGKSVLDIFQQRYGRHKVRMIEIGKLEMGVQAVRRIFPRCMFDEDNTKQGVRCLENYHREWDNEKKVFRNAPTHDWSSHGADCFRYLAMAYKEEKPQNVDINKDPMELEDFYFESDSGNRFCPF